MTPQDAFDIAVKHLAVQTKASRSSDASYCLYRSPGGNRCVVGAMIPDEMYLPEMDPNPISVLVLHYEEIRQLFDGIKTWFLIELQTVHDIEDNWFEKRRYQLTPEMARRLYAIAKRWGLDAKLVSEYE